MKHHVILGGHEGRERFRILSRLMRPFSLTLPERIVIQKRKFTSYTFAQSSAAYLLLFFVAIGSSACASSIIPPLEVTEPRAVAVLDHGRHASLVISTDSGTMIRYSYGDWNWYALEKEGIFRGAAALFWPTRAGMGRRELEGMVSVENIRRRVRVPSEEIYLIIVERSKVLALAAQLDSLFHENIQTRIYNSSYDLEFVHHPKRYCAFHNSNQMVAGWLEELGCEVRGLSIFSNWKLRHP